jgi:hypothetical protein
MQHFIAGSTSNNPPFFGPRLPKKANRLHITVTWHIESTNAYRNKPEAVAADK